VNANHASVFDFSESFNLTFFEVGTLGHPDDLYIYIYNFAIPSVSRTHKLMCFCCAVEVKAHWYIWCMRAQDPTSEQIACIFLPN